MERVMNPRSVLHALEPLGLGTGDVESLLSYFCRLAVSHSTSTLALARTVAQRFELEVGQHFDWHERQISGIRESALTWSSALSSMTSVPRLDALTFLPWRKVISQNGLSMVSKGQFCTMCLAEDLEKGQTPYYRLAWEAKSVSVCHKHGIPLTQRCSCCGRDNIRHVAALVVPGWCTKCGSFLGSQSPVIDSQNPVEPRELWKAKEIAHLLQAQHQMERQPQRQNLIDAIAHITDEVDGGRSTHFARRVGIAKSTIHHWLQLDGTPTLEMSLQMASQSGISLTQLLTGNTRDWKPPTQGQQMALQLLLPEGRSRESAREIDWSEIEAQLKKWLVQPTPISVLDAARQLEVEARQLYLHANQTTRLLGERWKAYAKRRSLARLDEALPQLEEVGRKLVMSGRSVTRREVDSQLPAEVLAKIPRLFDALRDVQDRVQKKMLLESQSQAAQSNAALPFV